jgi:hypothetical protein
MLKASDRNEQVIPTLPSGSAREADMYDEWKPPVFGNKVVHFRRTEAARHRVVLERRRQPLRACEVCGAHPAHWMVSVWWTNQNGHLTDPDPIERHAFCGEHAAEARNTFEGLAHEYRDGRDGA